MRKTMFLFIIVMTWALDVSAADEGLTFARLFDKVAAIERFEVLDIQGGDMGFPTDIGEGKMAIHPNATPREEIVSLISSLPEGSLVYDSTDEDGRFDRIFIEDGTSLLYVHVASGTGDTVVILFTDGNKQCIRDFIDRINKELSQQKSR